MIVANETNEFTTSRPAIYTLYEDPLVPCANQHRSYTIVQSTLAYRQQTVCLRDGLLIYIYRQFQSLLCVRYSRHTTLTVLRSVLAVRYTNICQLTCTQSKQYTQSGQRGVSLTWSKTYGLHYTERPLILAGSDPGANRTERLSVAELS